MVQLSTQQATLLSDAPVGHFSTASQAGAPHVIPVCFALDTQEEDYRICIVLDQKPKRAALTRLRRVRNILENPKVALVVDHYDADWSQLWYILLIGTAELLEGVDPLDSEHEGTSIFPAHPELVEGRSNDGERTRAITILRQKYRQYRKMDIDNNPGFRLLLGYDAVCKD